MDPSREAWRRKHRQQPAPWRGPVHAAPLLSGLSGRVVELGAAGGKVAQALPPHALALDWAPEGLRAPGLVADVRALPFREGSVDALVALHVLGHLLAVDRGRALVEWRRALSPGGLLVVEVFATGDAREGLGREVEAQTWEREGIATHHFDPDELRALLGGFEGEVVPETREARWGTRRVLRARMRRA